MKEIQCELQDIFNTLQETSAMSFNSGKWEHYIAAQGDGFKRG